MTPVLVVALVVVTVSLVALIILLKQFGQALKNIDI